MRYEAERVVGVGTIGIWMAVAGVAAPDASSGTELCVGLEGDAPITLRALTAAVRARIPHQGIVVSSCATRASAVWRAWARFEAEGRVNLRLEGPDLSAQRVLRVDGLSRPEMAQTIALTTVESMRQPLAAALGLTTAPACPPPASCPACPEPAPCPACAKPAPCPEAPPCPACAEPEPCPACPDPAPVREVPAALHFSLGIEAGPSASPEGISGWAGLRLLARVDRLFFAPYALVDPLGITGDTLRVIDVEFGAVVGFDLSVVRLGLAVQNRLHWVRVDGVDDAVESSTVWSGGFGVLGDVPLARVGSLEVGFTARVWVWLEPPRFRLEDIPRRQEPRFEVGIGPSLSWQIQ